MLITILCKNLSMHILENCTFLVFTVVFYCGIYHNYHGTSLSLLSLSFIAIIVIVSKEEQ